MCRLSAAAVQHKIPPLAREAHLALCHNCTLALPSIKIVDLPSNRGMCFSQASRGDFKLGPGLAAASSCELAFVSAGKCATEWQPQAPLAVQVLKSECVQTLVASSFCGRAGPGFNAASLGPHTAL